MRDLDYSETIKLDNYTIYNGPESKIEPFLGLKIAQNSKFLTFSSENEVLALV